MYISTCISSNVMMSCLNFTVYHMSYEGRLIWKHHHKVKGESVSPAKKMYLCKEDIWNAFDFCDYYFHKSQESFKNISEKCLSLKIVDYHRVNHSSDFWRSNWFSGVETVCALNSFVCQHQKSMIHNGLVWWAE